MEEGIRDQLRQMAEDQYRAFTAKLLPGTQGILGVRLPLIRKLAKELARGDWRALLAKEQDVYFEEVMLRGMVIGCAVMDAEERLRYIAAFVPRIDNWSVCDSFCGSLKFVRGEKTRVWSFLTPYFCSEDVFAVRFGLVMLLQYYLEEEYIDKVLNILANFHHEGYYAKMGAAWAISAAFIRFPDRTMQFLKSAPLDEFTHQKAIAKIRESLVVSKADKSRVGKLKRRS